MFHYYFFFIIIIVPHKHEFMHTSNTSETNGSMYHNMNIEYMYPTFDDPSSIIGLGFVSFI